MSFLMLWLYSLLAIAWATAHWKNNLKLWPDNFFILGEQCSTADREEGYHWKQGKAFYGKKEVILYSTVEDKFNCTFMCFTVWRQ